MNDMTATDSLVCVKFVQQTDGTPGRTLNPADEAALAAALHHRTTGKVTVLSMAPKSCEAGLRELLARGADKAVLLCDSHFAGSDSYATSGILAEAIRQLGPFGLIFCGRRAIDGETGQVPPALGTKLGLPCVTNVLDMEPRSDGILHCRRLLEEGVEHLACQTPAVLSLCEYSYPSRAPSLSDLRRAKGKQVEHLDAAALGIDPSACGLAGSPTRVEQASPHTSGLRRVTQLDLDTFVETTAKLFREVLI